MPRKRCWREMEPVKEEEREEQVCFYPRDIKFNDTLSSGWWRVSPVLIYSKNEATFIRGASGHNKHWSSPADLCFSGMDSTPPCGQRAADKARTWQKAEPQTFVSHDKRFRYVVLQLLASDQWVTNTELDAVITVGSDVHPVHPAHIWFLSPLHVTDVATLATTWSFCFQIWNTHLNPIRLNLSAFNSRFEFDVLGRFHVHVQSINTSCSPAPPPSPVPQPAVTRSARTCSQYEKWADNVPKNRAPSVASHPSFYRHGRG